MSLYLHSDITTTSEKKMPLIFAWHSWKKENFVTVTRKVVEALQQLPEGVTFCSSWVNSDMTKAWCVWEAKSAQQVKDYLKKKVPEMETDTTPAIVFFPPTQDLYGVIHTLTQKK